jgi:hypothetical protein
MKIITSKAAIVTAIESIRTRGKKLDNDIWVAAVSVTAHAEAHGDVTLANTLIDAMPKGSRVNALLAYLECFGKFSFDDEKKVLVFDKSKKTDLEGAMVASWVEFKPEPPYKGLDLNIAILALIKKATDRLDSDNESDVIQQEQLTALSALAESFNEVTF